MSLNTDHKGVNEEALSQHNKFRALHKVPLLTIDWDLAKSAQAHANNLAATNSFAHSAANGKYGENIACKSSSDKTYVFAGNAATEMWYGEIKDYNFNEERQTGRIGHFSQVVWKDTKTAGFGRAKTAGGKFIIVGQYKPAGNFIGKYMNNVLRPSRISSQLSSKSKEVPKSVLPTKSSTTSKSTPCLKPILITSPKNISALKSPRAIENGEKVKKLIPNRLGPKSPSDKLVKQSTKTIIKNNVKQTKITETYQTTDGKIYEISKEHSLI